MTRPNSFSHPQRLQERGGRSLTSASSRAQQGLHRHSYSFAASDPLEKLIRDLAAAEHSCCAFLEFDVSRIGDQIEMTVTAPPDGQEALHFIFSI